MLDATASTAEGRTGKAADAPDRGAPPATDPGSAAADAVQALDAKDLAENSGRAEAAHIRGRQELATFAGIQEIVRSLSGVRGRKAIVYFAVDHELGGGEISGGRASLAYARAMSEANRANVTVHTVDARGLACARVGGRSSFEQVCGSGAAGGTAGSPTASVSRTAATETERDDQGPLLGDPERLPGILHSPRPERFLSIHSGSLLEHVAEETGGLAITKTNDLAAGLVRVIDELREYYEVVYTPPRDSVFDGRFRRIEAKVSRRGVQVRTRAGYFATPETTPTMPRSSLR